MINLHEIILDLDIDLFLKFSIRLLLACISGLLIGIERKRKNREAGIRTHMIVMLGSCLAMLVSKYGFYDTINYDSSRIAAQVIAGIGFLGVGIIFVKEYDIKGLTTDAGIWTSSIIGLAYGAGLILIAILVTIMMFIIQIFIFEWLDSDQEKIKKIIIITDKFKTMNSIEKFLEEANIKHKEKMIGYDERGIKTFLKYKITDKKDNELFIEYLVKNEDVNKFYFL